MNQRRPIALPAAGPALTPVAHGRAAHLLERFESQPLQALLAEARAMREQAHGERIGHSRKVFIPLTRLCRDACSYCTFARTPRELESAFLSIDAVLAIARAGRSAGCREALFTLGDRPESRYSAARSALEGLGFASTVDYLEYACRRVMQETGLLAHVNAGVMDEAEIARLRTVSVSQGLMLESISTRLCERGGPHWGSPDKHPAARLAMIDTAGRLKVPFTSGILIGIGETRLERIEALLALADLQAHHGHLQEVIVQNFVAKPDTRMAASPSAAHEDLLWTAAVARLVLGPSMNIQVPPNLSFARFAELLGAGINDWGGISPVTADHVNPEAPWPALSRLREATEAARAVLVERLAIYPSFVRDAERWVDPAVRPFLLAHSDSEGFARDDDFVVGEASARAAGADQTASSAMAACGIGRTSSRRAAVAEPLERLLARAQAGERLDAAGIETLFGARGDAVAAVVAAADEARRRVNGAIVTYVVTRNINYTNLCSFSCSFCAFSKGRRDEDLRGAPYDLALDEVARRADEAWRRGASEVCMQGGIHPSYTGETYLRLLRTVKEAAPGLHVHAFSALEVTHGARTLGLSIERFLDKLKAAGLGSLPDTAAEILDDEVRAKICPDKLSTRQWLDVIEAAHRAGLPTTSTIMFGHVERPLSWARHLLHLRDLQARTGGLTEFVALPFVAMEAPMFRRGLARKGPTWRETVLMHAVARLVLGPLLTNIQASWTKLGPERVRMLLGAGVNDLGGTLMNESISRAAGASHGEEMPPAQMEALIRSADRTPKQRSTLYAGIEAARREMSLAAAPLEAIVLTPPRRRANPTMAQQR